MRRENNAALSKVLSAPVDLRICEERNTFESVSTLLENLFNLYFDFADFIDTFAQDDIIEDENLKSAICKRKFTVLDCVTKCANAQEKGLLLNDFEMSACVLCFYNEKLVLKELVRVFVSTSESAPKMDYGLPGAGQWPDV